MKTVMKWFLISVLSIMTAVSQNILNAQTPPAPPGHDKGGNQGMGSDTELETSLAVSLVMAAGFGVWKLLRSRGKMRKEMKAG
jgi:hypothetical protein